MQLFTNPASPFCRKVDVVLREIGMRDAVEDVSAIGHPTDSANMPTTINPLGKIPTLVRDDGPALYDSRVICRYLNDRARAMLYPQTRLWDVLTLEATGDGISEAALLIVYEGRSRPEDKQYAPWVEGQWSKVERTLAMLEDRWMSLLEGPLNAGQIAVGCALGYLDFRHGDRNWRAEHTALSAWFDDFGGRPAMQATRPEA